MGSGIETAKYRMNRTSDIPAEIRYIVPFAGWMERHPKVMNVIFVIEAVAVALAVFFYDFTTNI